MDCTPEQIELKRRLALAKLQARKLQQSLSDISPNISANSEHNHTLKSSNSRYTNQNQYPRNISSPDISNSIYYGSKSLSTNVNNNYGQSTSTVNNNFNSKILSNSNSKLHNSTPYSKTIVSPQKFFGKTITGTMTLISENRFEVNLSGYHTAAIDIFKSIPNRAYDLKKKLWNFDIKDYKLLLSKLHILRPEVVVGEFPSFVLKAIDDKKKYSIELDLSKIDSELLGALMPFQKEGVIFGVNRNGRVLIADDMGLGKTFQALGIAHYYKEDWPLLIATTASMRNTWQETIQKYLPSIPLMNIQYMTSGKDYIYDAQVLIVSRDLLSRCTEKLLERKYGVIILDESHEFKNFKSKCTQAAQLLAKNAKRIILLSGTPALSRPSELYTQLSLIDEKFFGNFFEYSKRYCDGQQSNFGWDSSGKSNLTELEIILSKKFLIRRTKNDVLQALPNKTREIVKLDLSLSKITDEERKILSQLIDQFKATKSGQGKHAALLTLFSQTGHIKIPSVRRYILKMLEEKVKFLVFAHHQKMLDAVCSVLQKSKVGFIRIDGNTSSEQRKYFIDKFQLNGSCICAVLSITATSAGITLTAAQVVLFAELHWNPSILSQAEGRAHRIGQQNDVQVRYLLADGTADDYIWPMLLEKQDVLSEAGLTKESFKDVNIIAQIPGEQNNSTNTLDSWLKADPASEMPSNLLQDDNDDLFLDIDIQL